MPISRLPRGIPRPYVICRHHYPCAPERRRLLLYLYRGGLRARKRRCAAATIASAATSPIANVGSCSLSCRACIPRRISIPSPPTSAPRGLGRHGGKRGSGCGQRKLEGGGAKLKVCLGRPAARALAFTQPFSFDNVHLASGLAGIFRLGGVVEC
jgi:hypothetical protein